MTASFCGEPALVTAAKAAAEADGFTESCTDGVGRLLRILARHARRVGEIGSGYGVGAAWLACGLGPGSELVTIELDPGRAAATRALLKPEPAVRVRQGDWHELLREPPFDLLFADGGDAAAHGEDVVTAVAHGGMVVLDDLPPSNPDVATPPDPVRAFWTRREDLLATELQTAPGHRVLLVARR